MPLGFSWCLKHWSNSSAGMLPLLMLITATTACLVLSCRGGMLIPLVDYCRGVLQPLLNQHTAATGYWCTGRNLTEKKIRCVFTRRCAFLDYCCRSRKLTFSSVGHLLILTFTRCAAVLPILSVFGLCVWCSGAHQPNDKTELRTNIYLFFHRPTGVSISLCCGYLLPTSDYPLCAVGALSCVQSVSTFEPCISRVQLVVRTFWHLNHVYRGYSWWYGRFGLRWSQSNQQAHPCVQAKPKSNSRARATATATTQTTHPQPILSILSSPSHCNQRLSPPRGCVPLQPKRRGYVTQELGTWVHKAPCFENQRRHWTDTQRYGEMEHGARNWWEGLAGDVAAWAGDWTRELGEMGVHETVHR